MSFDLIIANPPYHNRLYKSIIEVCHKYAKETCVLCPWEFVDHKVEKRFQDFIDRNLSALEKIDNSKREFFDIGKDNLGIVCLGEKRLNLKDFQTNRSYKSKVTDLLIQYNENKNNFKVYVQPNRNPDKFKGKLNTANCFAKACRGGFHFGGKNFDYIFNTTKDPKIIFSGENGLKIGQDIVLLDLENSNKKANLVKWIYNSKLALFLVKEGLKDSRSTLGSFHTLIPFVDWSHPWTDQEILKEIGLPEDFLERNESEKIGDANRGRKLGSVSEETRRKLSEVRKGRSKSEEHKRNISEAAAIAVTAYKEYKANGGEMSWNSFRAKYSKKP